MTKIICTESEQCANKIISKDYGLLFITLIITFNQQHAWLDNTSCSIVFSITVKLLSFLKPVCLRVVTILSNIDGMLWFWLNSGKNFLRENVLQHLKCHSFYYSMHFQFTSIIWLTSYSVHMYFVTPLSTSSSTSFNVNCDRIILCLNLINIY